MKVQLTAQFADNTNPIASAQHQSRRSLLRAYHDVNDAFVDHLWDEADQTLPTKAGYRTGARDRRELRLACMMGGPL